MADPTGESKSEALRLDFDRRLILRFRGSVITSDGGLLPYRELDEVLALTTTRRREIGRGTHRQEPTPPLGRIVAAVGIRAAARLPGRQQPPSAASPSGDAL